MPAHCTAAQIGVKRLSNGEALSALDLKANALVDQMAKEAAGADRVPPEQRRAVKATWDKFAAVAMWIGHATVLATEFPDPAWRG
eukprot:9830177-Karenia_brevis.AAC.1